MTSLGPTTTCRTHERYGEFASPECCEEATHWVTYKQWPTPLCTEHMEKWTSDACVDSSWKIP